jgi:CDP-diacylglycerol--serine O-phosphatidyltransferase
MRLARFNIEQAGRKKTYFHGLPTPAAGITLATYYWFSQTPLYSKSVILFTDSTLSDLPWHVILRGLMAVLAALMISEVPYPNVPAIGWRTPRKLLGSVVVLGSVVLLLVRKEEFIFPALLAYVLYGFLRAAVLGMLSRAGSPEEAYGDEEGEPSEEETRRAQPPRMPPRIAAAGVSAETFDGRPHSRDEDSRESRDGARGDAQLSRRRRRRRGGGQRGSRPSGSSPPNPSPPPSPPDSQSGKPE